MLNFGQDKVFREYKEFFTDQAKRQLDKRAEQKGGAASGGGHVSYLPIDLGVVGVPAGAGEAAGGKTASEGGGIGHKRTFKEIESARASAPTRPASTSSVGETVNIVDSDDEASEGGAGAGGAARRRAKIEGGERGGSCAATHPPPPDKAVIVLD